MVAAESSQVQAITWKNFFFFSLSHFLLSIEMNSKNISQSFLRHLSVKRERGKKFFVAKKAVKFIYQKTQKALTSTL